MFDYLNFINVEIPSNVKAFISIFDQNILNMTPNLFSQKEFDEKPSDAVEDEEQSTTRRVLIQGKITTKKCKVHYLLKENEMSCYFLNSVGDLMIHFFAYILIKILIMILVKIFQVEQIQ
jgi:hypothetical protein